MTEKYLWEFILINLERKIPVVLLCVVESIGSSPGRRGFKMAVTGDEISGSIGGGMMEHKFVEMARSQLVTSPDTAHLKKQIHSKSAKLNQSGMICSGEQTIILFNLRDENIPAVRVIHQVLKENKNGILKITPFDISFSEENNSNDGLVKVSDYEWNYSELTGYKNHIYIIGAGHCGLALSKLMRELDFYIHLFDNREELNTFENNSYAHEKTLVDDYSGLQKLIPSGENNYVVIMTFGYRSDDVSLRSIINNKYRYLGVLGSRTKITQLFEEWRRDNLPEEILSYIHAPVGFSINSQTPAEIAVSIAAEIIAEKNSVGS